jgi:hypothetical protein
MASSRFLRDNGLSLVLLLLFLLTMTGQWLSGWCTYNEDRSEHGASAIGMWEYLATGHFFEATGENWESEFLQMGLFVVLTAILFQKGSPESHDPDKPQESLPVTDDSPWPVRRGGWWLVLYRYSLSLCFLALFLVSWSMHALGGLSEVNHEHRLHGQPTESLVDYLGSARFWFESFQNWQSEFLSLVAMVYLAVFLRHEGSAESKPVAAPHHEHGE